MANDYHSLIQIAESLGANVISRPNRIDFTTNHKRRRKFCFWICKQGPSWFFGTLHPYFYEILEPERVEEFVEQLLPNYLDRRRKAIPVTVPYKEITFEEWLSRGNEW